MTGSFGGEFDELETLIRTSRLASVERLAALRSEREMLATSDDDEVPLSLRPTEPTIEAP